MGLECVENPSHGPFSYGRVLLFFRAPPPHVFVVKGTPPILGVPSKKTPSYLFGLGLKFETGNTQLLAPLKAMPPNPTKAKLLAVG